MAKAYRAGAVCETHGFVHSRPKSSERATLRAKVIAVMGRRCAYCLNDIYGPADTVEMDRVIEGCAYIFGNLIPACKACNNARNRAGAVWADDVADWDGLLLTLTDQLRGSRSKYADDIKSTLVDWMD